MSPFPSHDVLGDLPLGPQRPEDRQAAWGRRLAISAAVLLLHLGALFLRPAGWLATPVPPRVELTPIDASQLAKIREAWRKNEGKLLLKKDSAPAAPDSPDARYQSDRNRVVEREQQARRTAPMPRSGGQARPKIRGENRPDLPDKGALKNLARLALPMDLNGTEVSAPKHQARREQEEIEPGADQALLDENIPLGGENLLNTRQAIYYSFYARIYEAVVPLWAQQLNRIPTTTRVMAGEYVALVEIVLDRDGNLDDIRWIQSSGVALFDEAVSTAWRKVRRFPNPPAALIEKDGRVRIGWTFTLALGQNTGVRLLPPEDSTE